MSWDRGGTAATRLKDWLDPDNTDAETLGGLEGPPRLENLALASGAIQKAKVYTAVSSVSAGTGVTIEAGGDVRFVAGGHAGGDVTLSPGFHAKAGSEFRAYLDPGLIPPAPDAPTGLVILNAGNNGVAPELWWNASSGATSYKVYRKYAYSDWSLIASPSFNNYTDVGAELNSGSSFSISYYVIAVNTGVESGASSTVSALGYLLKEKPGIPDVYALHNAYPNPFNPTATIRFDLPEVTNVTLIVYDLRGREVVRLVNAPMDTGYHAALWHGRDATGRPAPSGMYIARLVTANYTKSIKMVLLK